MGVTFYKTFGEISDCDSVSYHIPAPKKWLKQGFSYDFPKTEKWPYLEALQFNYPLHLEAIFAIPIHFGKERLSQTIHWLFALFTVLAIIFWDKTRPFTERLFQGAVFSSLPVVTHFSRLAMNDLAVCFYGYLSYLTRSTWWLSGLFGGWMMACRYQGAILFGIWMAVTRNWKGFLLGCLAGGGWYLKNFIEFGDPMFPYLLKQTLIPQEVIDLHAWNLIRHQLVVIGSWNPFSPNFTPLAGQYFLFPLAFTILYGWLRRDSLGDKTHWLASAIYFPTAYRLKENWWRFCLPLIPVWCGYLSYKNWWNWFAFIPVFFLR